MPPRRKARSAKQPAFADAAVADCFDAYPPPLRRALLDLRRLIFETAAETEGVGALEETLKWGQPSYLTPETSSGSTIRIDAVKDDAEGYALYVNCQTDLIDSYRQRYGGELTFGGKRSVLFSTGAPPPEDAVRHCIALALTYHQRKRKARRRTVAAPAR